MFIFRRSVMPVVAGLAVAGVVQKLTSFLMAVVATAALLGPIGAAHAAAPLIQSSAVVRYSDLNVQRTEGASALYERIRAAAKRVCGDLGRSMGLGYLQTPGQTCRARAIHDAVQHVDVPLLRAIHEARASLG